MGLREIFALLITVHHKHIHLSYSILPLLIQPWKVFKILLPILFNKENYSPIADPKTKSSVGVEEYSLVWYFMACKYKNAISVTYTEMVPSPIDTGEHTKRVIHIFLT